MDKNIFHDLTLLIWVWAYQFCSEILDFFFLVSIVGLFVTGWMSLWPSWCHLINSSMNFFKMRRRRSWWSRWGRAQPQSTLVPNNCPHSTIYLVHSDAQTFNRDNMNFLILWWEECVFGFDVLFVSCSQQCLPVWISASLNSSSFCHWMLDISDKSSLNCMGWPNDPSGGLTVRSGKIFVLQQIN